MHVTPCPLVPPCFHAFLPFCISVPSVPLCFHAFLPFKKRPIINHFQ